MVAVQEQAKLEELREWLLENWLLVAAEHGILLRVDPVAISTHYEGVNRVEAVVLRAYLPHGYVVVVRYELGKNKLSAWIEPAHYCNCQCDCDGV